MRLCCLSSRRPGVVLSCQLVVALPLVVLSLRRPLIVLSRQLVVASIALPSYCLAVPAGCRIASHRPLVVPPSHQLVVPACCRIASPCPLVTPRTALLSSHCTGWLLCCLSMRPRLVISSSCYLVVPPLVLSLRQLVVAPSSLVILSLHRPLILS